MRKNNIRPFHVAFPVYDLGLAKAFYVDVLGCEVGRENDHWVDLNLYGHQIVAHLSEDASATVANPVDGKHVPVPHFGVILEWDDWQALKDRLIAHDTAFVVEPYVRFEGKVGEQATMFFLDPSNNALEFKTFKDDNMIFETKGYGT